MNVKVFDGGYMPRRAHFDDAGIDLLTPEGFTLRPGESRVVDLKVGFEIPVGYFGKLESKSGLNVNHGVICPGEVVYIKATVTPQPIEGNMIRCITADTGVVIYCAPDELTKAGESDVHER